MKDEVECKAAGALLLAGVGLEREREVLFEVGRGEALVILDLEAFGAVSGNGDDLCGEERRGAWVFVITLTGFEQTGVDRLEARLIVDLLGAFALENDGGDAHWPIPDSKIGDRGATGQREAVGALFDVLGVVGEYLDDG